MCYAWCHGYYDAGRAVAAQHRLAAHTPPRGDLVIGTVWAALAAGTIVVWAFMAWYIAIDLLDRSHERRVARRAAHLLWLREIALDESRPEAERDAAAREFFGLD